MIQFCTKGKQTVEADEDFYYYTASLVDYNKILEILLFSEKETP